MATNNAINQIGVLPSFSAYSAVDQSNVTGDTTVYSVIFPNIIYNTTSSFDGTSTFTAPLSGTYLFNVGLFYTGFTALNTPGSGLVTLVTTGKNYILDSWAFGYGLWLPPITYEATRSQICKLSAGDTVSVTLSVSQGGAKTIGITGQTSATFYTPIFSGYMIAGI